MALPAVWSRTVGLIASFASGGALARAFQPIFELLRQESWQANPYAILGPGQLAQLVANGIVDYGAAAEQAQRSGLDGNKFRALVELELRAPTIGQAMDARRRELITDAEYVHALRKAGYEPQYDGALRGLLQVLPPVTDLIRMAVREVFSPGQRAALDLDAEFPGALIEPGGRVGLEPSTLRDYWAAHWELPSYSQLTEMLFRQEITRGEFQGALRALDYAPTWRGPLEAIARRIPTITDMVRFAVREVYDPVARAALGIDAEYPAAFTEQASLHGMSELHARQYWASHWRLPSARQGYQMVWRKVMGEPELKTLLKALDYPPKWRDRLFEIAYLKPGRIDLKRMLRHEILTRAQVVAGYEAIGYAPDDAELMAQIAEAEIGTGDEVGTYVAKARGTLWNRIHTEFVSRQLTGPEVDAGLEAVGVPAAQREKVKTLWAFEALLVRTELTQAQIVKGHKKGLLTDDEAIAELVERGMTDADARKRLLMG